MSYIAALEAREGVRLVLVPVDLADVINLMDCIRVARRKRSIDEMLSVAAACWWLCAKRASKKKPQQLCKLQVAQASAARSSANFSSFASKPSLQHTRAAQASADLSAV